MEANTVTRYVGTCQICEGEFKLDLARNMVHHGFKRPGWGHIVGDCSAVGQPAYEQSCEYLKAYTQAIKGRLAAMQLFLSKLQAGEIQQLTAPSRKTRYSRNPEMITYKPGDEDWSQVLDNAIASEERDIRYITRDITRCEKRIADWKLEPLRTVEEEVAAQRATKEAAKAVRDAKRQAKIEKMVAGYQKRIDSAVRRHTTSVVADIFESAPNKLQEAVGWGTIDAPQALAMLQRDHVWAAFDLDITRPRGTYGERSKNSEICSNMRYPEYKNPETKKYPWPEGL